MYTSYARVSYMILEHFVSVMRWGYFLVHHLMLRCGGFYSRLYLPFQPPAPIPVRQQSRPVQGQPPAKRRLIQRQTGTSATGQEMPANWYQFSHQPSVVLSQHQPETGGSASAQASNSTASREPTDHNIKRVHPAAQRSGIQIAVTMYLAGMEPHERRRA